MKFCGKCGNKLERLCSRCEFVNPPDFLFCGNCGKEIDVISIVDKKNSLFEDKLFKGKNYLPRNITEKVLAQKEKIQGERKQVTIMFCDMKGFTPFVEKLGEEDSFNIMDQLYEILIQKVHEYGGIVNELTGDGIMALFGAPIALEDAPQRAVRSAHAIHISIAKFSDKIRRKKRSIPPIKMRIGIHCGPVVVGTLGNDLRIEFKAVGDTVNIASRIEGLAESGSTLVTESIFCLTEGFFQFEALGEYMVKGKSSPVKAYRVIGLKDRRTRFDVSAGRKLTSFIGRQRELELLLDGFDRVKDGRGQAFSIVSEAGIGKSRLLYEFRKALASEDVTFIEGKCFSYSKGVPYHLHIDTLKASFNIGGSDSAPAIIKKIRGGLNILNVDETDTLPHLLELLSVRDEDTQQSQVSHEVKKKRIFEAFKRIVLSSCKLRPLILAYEDLHWIDKTSLEYIEFLINIIPRARILLIFTYRPEFLLNIATKSYHNQIVLNRLSNRESLMLASKMLGASILNGKLEEYILEKSDGVPFFIEELVRSLRESKAIQKKGDLFYIAEDIKQLSIPSTVQDVIMVRVDALPESTKEFLQTAAVIGRKFSHEIIEDVAELSEKKLLANLSLLKDTEHIYERGIYPESTYLFKHALTQEMVYNSLLSKKKLTLHERIGEAIEKHNRSNLEEYYEILAYHYGRSNNYGKNLDYLDLANQKAAKLCAMNEAKAYFDKSMQILDKLGVSEKNSYRRISILSKQGAVIELQLGFQEYYDLLMRYESVARELDSPVTIGAFYCQLGQCHFAFGNYDKATKTLSKAITLCNATGNFEEISQAYAYLILSHLDCGNFDEVIDLKNELINISDQYLNIRWHVRGISAVGNAYAYRGDWGNARVEGSSALELAKRHSDDSLISLATSNLSLSYCWQGNFDEAIKHGRTAVEKAATPGDISRSKRSLGLALCRSGDTENGIKTITEAVLPIFKSGGFVAFEIPLLSFLGECYFLTGKHQKAMVVLKEGLEKAERSKAKFYIGFINRIMAQVLLEKNSPRADSLFRKSIASLTEIRADNELANTYMSYSKFFEHQNNMDKATDYSKRAIDIFDHLGTNVIIDAACNYIPRMRSNI